MDATSRFGAMAERLRVSKREKLKEVEADCGAMPEKDGPAPAEYRAQRMCVFLRGCIEPLWTVPDSY
jgi:hypothetical protein